VSGWDPILAAARTQRVVFERACAAPRDSQSALLRQILDANAETDFGREHGFESIDSIDVYRARVPIRPYEALRQWLDRVTAGERSVLTREPVVAYEETGGTGAGRKLIPYTASSLDGFRAAVLPWLADLAERRPGAFEGTAYVAISPVARAPRSIGGVPVGLPSEGAYLGDDLIAPFLNVLAVPPSVASHTDIEQWRITTLAHLVASPDLTLISVWSPTFLIALLDAIAGLAEPLLRAVRDGAFGIAADPSRARDIEAAVARSPLDTARLWPRLDTVSAWADGASRPYARRLAEMLPHAFLQPKGLLATEGAATTPCSSSWPIPALTSAFLEFIDDAGRPHPCDELRAGESYRVVMTNAGGFYRYDLGDRLRCHGHAGLSPLLEFVGRDIVSDLVGEKLCEAFISEALGALDGAACLAPRATATPFYELLIEDGCASNVMPMAALVDQRLCANPQYAYARRIGQLGPVGLRVVEGLMERYTKAQARRGRRLADIKAPTLIDASLYSVLINQVDSGISDFQATNLPAYAYRGDSVPRAV
jgi:hypothetical protein